MIEKFEALKDVEVELGVTSKIFLECLEKDATHIHKCYHDEDPPKPCRRIII